MKRGSFGNSAVVLLIILSAFLAGCTGELKEQIAAQKVSSQKDAVRIDQLEKELATARSTISKLEEELRKEIASRPKKRDVPEIFKTQLMQYLKDAGKLAAETGTGVSYNSAQTHLREALATFDIIEQIWPANLASDAKEDLRKSHQGYALALKLWNLLSVPANIDEPYLPGKPDKNGFEQYEAFAGDSLILSRFTSSDRLYIMEKDNVGILLGKAMAHFQRARTILLKELEGPSP